MPTRLSSLNRILVFYGGTAQPTRAEALDDLAAIIEGGGGGGGAGGGYVAGTRVLTQAETTIANDSFKEFDVPCVGAVVGDRPVVVYWTALNYPTTGAANAAGGWIPGDQIRIDGWCVAPDVIRVRFSNRTGGGLDMGVGGANVRVFQFGAASGGGGGGGTTWHDGAAAPGAGLGADGDYYLRTTNGDVYKKTAGAWAVVGNIMGPAGAVGPAGPAGPPGSGGSGGGRSQPNLVSLVRPAQLFLPARYRRPRDVRDVPFPVIANMEFRLSAALSRFDLVDGRVARWYDISGNNLHSNTQATVGRRPWFYPKRFNGGFPGVYFSGSATSALVTALTVPLSAPLIQTTSPYSFVFVFQDYFGGTASFHLVRGANVLAVSFRDPAGAGNWSMYDGTIASSAALYAQNIAAPLLQGETAHPAVRIDVYNGAASVISNNGVEVVVNPGTGAAGGMTSPVSIGCEIVAGTHQQAARMLLYEIICFRKALTLAERQALNAYYTDPLVAGISLI